MNDGFEKMKKKMSEGFEKKKKKGGIITLPFIFASDVCEKLAVVGIATNMINYLTTELHMPITKAATTITNFAGTASLTPLLGAIISDSFAGKFMTITVASTIYLIGMISLTLSAIIPKLRPPPCKGEEVCQVANSGQLIVLYLSLLFGAIGSGGIRPCAVAFGADQFDDLDSSKKTKSWNYYNWYYFVTGVAMLVSVTVLVYIQDNVGWGWGLGIPTIAMFLSIITFIGGYPLYRHLNPKESPFTGLVRVCVAAFRKRKIPEVSDSKMLYRNDELDASITLKGKLLHSDQFKFLDKAATVTEEDNTKTPDLWRLCTVHRVEELKSIIRMGPIWASGILLITAYSQINTFSLQQGKTMDRHLTKSFQIPAGSMYVFTLLAMLITTALYDRVLIPVSRRFTKLDRGISVLCRMAIGLVISIFPTLVAGFIEMKRKKIAMEHGLIEHSNEIIPMSVFWLLPQYCLYGMAEAFMSIGHIEFFNGEAPESMTSTAMAFYWISISIGNYVSTLMVTLVHKFSAGSNGENWLPDNNLNKGKLEYFYWLITIMQVINLIYYLVCAKMYTYRKIQNHNEENNISEDNDIELNHHEKNNISEDNNIELISTNV